MNSVWMGGGDGSWQSGGDEVLLWDENVWSFTSLIHICSVYMLESFFYIFRPFIKDLLNIYDSPLMYKSAHFLLLLTGSWLKLIFSSLMMDL